jgi:hypothetical protein
MVSQSLDVFQSLSAQAYEISKPKPPEDAYAFYKNYIKNANGLALEPMCGAGRFLIPLLEEGLPIQGFDGSDAMLEILRSKAKLKNLHPTVWKSYLQNLAKPDRYNIIFIPSGSFCIITDKDMVKASLRAFYTHLENDGIFVFEAKTPKSIPPSGIWRGSKWTRADGKKIIAFQCSSLEGNICSFVNKYELFHDNKIILTEIEELNVRIYDPEEMVAILKDVGFRSVKMIKAFDPKRPPDNSDETIVYECHR